MRRPARVLLVLPLVLAGCFKNPGAPETTAQPGPQPALQEDRLVIITDPAVLASRVTWTNVPLFIEAKEVPQQQVTPDKPARTDITLVGEVTSPLVDDNLVQANDIDIQGTYAVVAYNFAGAVFAGAVQVLDFRIPERPRLLAEVLFSHADVTAVVFHGNFVYVGLGSSDPALSSSALVEEFYLDDNVLEHTGRWIDLPSKVVTDLASSGDDLVATVGALEGGIALVDRALGLEQLQLESFAPEYDMRGLAYMSSDKVIGVCGTTPRMGEVDIPGLNGRMAAIDGYTNPEAKGTIEFNGDLCWLGAGDGGFQVRNSEGELVARLDNRQFSDVRPDLMVTNAVSVSNNRAYVAAGALGVQVVDVTSVRQNRQEKELHLMGELIFPEGMSSNMVKVRGSIMVVAAGSGGIKLAHMRTTY